MIKIIGIDPAPSKESTIFDGKEFLRKKYGELQSYLDALKDEVGNILICWDAPLSFSLQGVTDKISPLYERKIEYFFSRKDWSETPSGISVRGYAGCSHWTISQYILGYPKVGRSCNYFKPDFELIFEKNHITKSVTEVHPAVAIWLWCKDNKAIKNWNYKGVKKENEKVLDSILDELKSISILDDKTCELIKEKPRKQQDDRLDAYIAWKLGCDWIKEDGSVKILGDNETGSFLLPHNEQLFEKFGNFKENSKKTLKKHDKYDKL